MQGPLQNRLRNSPGLEHNDFEDCSKVPRRWKFFAMVYSEHNLVNLFTKTVLLSENLQASIPCLTGWKKTVNKTLAYRAQIRTRCSKGSSQYSGCIFVPNHDRVVTMQPGGGVGVSLHQTSDDNKPQAPSTVCCLIYSSSSGLLVRISCG